MNKTPTTTLALPPPRLTLIEEFNKASLTLAASIKLAIRKEQACDYNLRTGWRESLVRIDAIDRAQNGFFERLGQQLTENKRWPYWAKHQRSYLRKNERAVA